MDRSIIVLSLLAVLHLQYSYGEDCYMEGIPDEASNRGEVYFMVTEEDAIDVTITCKCSINSPKWDAYNLATKETNSQFTPIQCIDNGVDCSPTTYISQANQSNGFYVYLNHTFHLNSSTVLMCYSRTEREVLVVHFNKSANVQQPIPTPSATPVVSTVVVTSTIVTTATTTATTTVLRTIVKSADTSATMESLPTPTTTPGLIDREVTGSIVDEVGTPTLALVPVIIVLVVMLVILVGCIIAMKVRHKERTKEMNGRIDLLNKTNGTLEGSLQRLLPVYDDIGDRRLSFIIQDKSQSQTIIPATVGNHYVRTPMLTENNNMSTGNISVV